MVIRPPAVGWVPSDAWLTPRYAEWQAPAVLRGAVACLWAGVTPDDAGRDAPVLPDGCSDLIWEEGAGATVAGPDTRPASATGPAPGAVIVGVRFRPAAGGLVLGLPLSELRDQRAPLDDVLPGLATGLTATLSPAEAAARLLRLAGGSSPTAPPTRPSRGPRSCCATRPRAPRTSRIRWASASGSCAAAAT